MSWGNHDRSTRNRIRACAIALAALAASIAYADPLAIEWVAPFEVVAPPASGPGGVHTTRLAMDGAGNLYILGAFSGTVDLDLGPEAVTLASVDDNELFLAKLDPEGAFMWARHFESSQGANGSVDTAATSFAVDSAGNAHIAGAFTGTVDMDPGLGTRRLTAISDFGDGFVLKLDSEGDFLWAQHLVATEAAIADIAVDNAGNVSLAGSFFGAADVDPGPEPFTLNSLLSTSHFVCQWNADGAFVWANQLLATTATSSAMGGAIAVDASGNVYTAGTFQFAVEFETDPTKAIVATSTSTFLAKFDPAGAVTWVDQFDQSGMDDGAYGLEIVLDDADNPVLTGVFTGGIDADPGNATATLSTPLDAQAIFTIKLDPSGNLLWANQTGATGAAVVASTAANSAGTLFTVGQFEGTLDLDPSEGVLELTSVGETDAYIRVLNADGTFDTAASWGGATADSATQVVANAAGSAYVLGTFSGAVDFDLGPGSATLTAPAEGAVYLAKLSPIPCMPPDAPTGLIASDGVNVDAVDLSWEPVAGANIEYQVFRSATDDVTTATAVSDWIADTTFADATADPPTPGPVNCSGVPIPTFTTFYYWVRARESGAFCAGAFSTSDAGYRGTDTPVEPADATAMLVMLIILVLAPAIRSRRRAD